MPRPCCAIVTPDGIPRVLFKGLNDHIIELYLSPSDQAWHWRDYAGLYAALGIPLQDARTYPFAYMDQNNIARVVYAGTNGHIYELNLAPIGSGPLPLACNDISLLSNAPAVQVDQPFVWTYTTTHPGVGSVRRLVYLDVNGDVSEIRLEAQSWIYANLSTASKAPVKPAYVPVAYVTPDGVPRVLYCGTNHGIHELRLDPNCPWTHAELTDPNLTQFSPELARGYPWPYVTPWDGIARVVYLGQDYWIHEIRLEKQGWVHANLSKQDPSTPQAWGRLFAHVTDGVARVLFTTGHVHELRLEQGSGQGWVHADLHSMLASPWKGSPANDPVEYVAKNVRRILYRGNDHHIYELRLEPPWVLADLSMISGAPLAAA
jgi:hypothetical protein